jgi:hypothetical protein
MAEAVALKTHTLRPTCTPEETRSTQCNGMLQYGTVQSTESQLMFHKYVVSICSDEKYAQQGITTQ